MKEEDKIRKKCGTDNPFKVPENYFDNFTSQLMSRLPEKETIKAPQRKPLMKRLRPLWCAAAIVCGVVFCLQFFMKDVFFNKQEPEVKMSEALKEAPPPCDYYIEDAIDSALDYAMVGNQEIASYLTEAN